MQDILGQVADTYGRFRPSSVDEVTALYVARLLDDAPNVRGYVSLVNRYDSYILRAALKSLFAKGTLQGGRVDLLLSELEGINNKEVNE